LDNTPVLDKKTRTKNAIIDAAQELFFEKGYHGTDMGQIAQIVGIDKRTIYRYFDSKEALAFVIWRRVIAEIVNFASSSRGGTAFEKLENLLYDYMDAALKNSKIIRFIGEFDHVFSGEYPHIEEADEFVRYITESPNKILEYVNEGIKEGSIKNDIDAGLAAHTISSIMIAMSQRIIIRGEHLKQEQGYSYEMLKETVRLMLSGIKVG